MSDAISAQGTKISVAFNAGSPTDFTELPEVKSIPGPDETSDEIEVTHLGSVGGRREFIQSFRDTDDSEIEMNYVPGNAVQEDFLELFDTGAVRPYKVEYPDGATAIFDAFVKGRGRGATVGEALMIRATLRITGAVTFTGS